MPRMRKQLPAHPGAGELRYRGFQGPVLDDGKTFRLSMLGHTEGSNVAYFEMRV